MSILVNQKLSLHLCQILYKKLFSKKLRYGKTSITAVESLRSESIIG